MKDWDEKEYWLGKQQAKIGMKVLSEEESLKAYFNIGPNRRTTKMLIYLNGSHFQQNSNPQTTSNGNKS